MQRACIVNTKTSFVENIIDYDELTVSSGDVPPGFSQDYILIFSQSGKIGDTYSGGQFEPPTPDGSLVERREKVWVQIKSVRSEKQNGGVQVAGKWFHTDQSSRIQQLGLVLINGNLAPGIMWKTMDGSFIEMTNEIASQLLAAVSQLDIEAYTCAEVHKAAVYALSNPESYDYSTGWPAVYVP